MEKRIHIWFGTGTFVKKLVFVTLTVCSLLTQAESAHAQSQLGWISFRDSLATTSESYPYIKEESTSGILVNFDIPGIYIYEITVNETLFHRLTIPGWATTTEIGRPEVPIQGAIIEIPYGVEFELEVVKSEFQLLTGYSVYPAQDQDQQLLQREHAFEFDSVTYQTEELYPQELTTISQNSIQIVRGHRLLFLKINPIQFNPVTRELMVYSNVEVRVNYDRPAQVDHIDERLISQVYEDILASMVLNYKEIDRFGWYSGLPPIKFAVSLNLTSDDSTSIHTNSGPGCDYLIITTNSFYNPDDANNPVARFRNWKQQKGIETQIEVLSNIPDSDSNGAIDENDIRAYIQTAYDTWDPPPTYILLIGDAGDNAGNVILPTNYRTQHPSSHNSTTIPTDLYYVTVDGDDYFPDILIGRLPVDSLTELTNIVEKIIAYEQNPPNQASFFTDVALIALFEDIEPRDVGGDGVEERPWIEVVEEILLYLTQNGYSVNRIFNTSGPVVPQFYRDGVTPVPAGLAWNGDAGDISNSINSGRCLLVYRDHGSRRSWANQFGFDVTDILGLSNGPLNPVVLSMCCQTGWFDNETDDDTNLFLAERTADNSESFCEHFLYDSTGAVAIIGSTRNSYTGYNDFLTYGMCKALWPGFNPQGPFTSIPDITPSPIPRMGQVITFGLIYMANAYNHSTFREVEFEMFHLFGDPEMPIWTNEPHSFTVVHPSGIGSVGQQDFIVNVGDAGNESVRSAVVTLTREGEIVSVRQTDVGGNARFTSSFPSGSIDITVSALNYQPYIGEIEVLAGGASIGLDPDDGPNGQVFNVEGQNFSGSETVNITLDGQLVTTQAAPSGEIGQAGSQNLSFTVPIDLENGLYNVVAEGVTSGRYASDVFHIRDPNPVDLLIYCQGDNSTWYLHPSENPTWNNPEIQLYDSSNNFVSSNNLTVGNTYTIRATIHNDADFDADNAAITFKWAKFGAGQGAWFDIIDQSGNGIAFVDVPANDHHTVEMQWVPTLTGHTCITVNIHHAEDTNPSNNQGQENCHVGQTSSPGIVALTVTNPNESPSAVYFELRQLNLNQDDGPIWNTMIRHPDPQVIEPHEETVAEIVLDPDWTYIEPGKTAEFSMTGFINGEVVGGVNVIIERRLKRFVSSIHAGFAMPHSTFANYYEPGLSLFADIGYSLTPQLAVVGLIGYNKFQSRPAAPTDTHWFNLNLNAYYRLHVGNRLSTYFRGGLGIYVPESGDQRMGTNVCAGFLYHLSNLIALSLGYDYHNIAEGMGVYQVNAPDVNDNIKYSVLHLGTILNLW